MRLLIESGGLIDGLSFDENTGNRIYRHLSIRAADAVQRLNDCTIQFPQQEIFPDSVSGQVQFGSSVRCNQRTVSLFDLIDPRGCRQVQTQPRTDDGSDNSR